MKIEMRPTNSVKPYDHNPRDNDDAVEAVARSIKEFGFRQPIVVDTEGVIVVGHTRHRAALLLELAEVPVHVAADLSPAKLKAYRIADNKTGELATWNSNTLASELVDLRELADVPDAEIDMEALGFGDDELEELIGDNGEPDLDATPEPDGRSATPGGDAVGSRVAVGRVHCGDSRDWLKTLKSESFAACVTDPPYNLGFMGRAWDKTGIAMDTDFWRGVFRVLKPGAHLAAFGGTRTYHRIACAIEDAGFDVRDCLMWVYGTGFPKGIDVSGAIDKAAGAERETVRVPAAKCQNPKVIKGGHGVEGGDRPWLREARKRGYHELQGDMPVTPEAAKWDGWNVALKPGWEPIILVRKPLSEKTVAANVLKHGTGAINVGACRLGTEKRINVAAPADQRSEKIYGEFLGKGARAVTGRWPANTILQHAPECVRVGTREVKTSVAVNRNLDGHTHDGTSYGFRQAPREDVTYADESGRETVDLWACVPGCPVRMIDEQSGHIPQSRRGINHDAPGMFGTGNRVRHNVGHTDSGGASRFFYCPKAPTRERSAGLPDGERSMHPTVKPISLMRWLVRLLAPPGGTILEPFAGSGTTCCACELEGFDYEACEQDETYAKNARLRAAHWRGVAEELRASTPVDAPRSGG